MSTLAAEKPKMGRKETDKVVQAALNPEEYEQFKIIADKKGWSDKRLNERIIKLFLAEAKKKPTRLNDL